jgi:hypothetical protein
MAQRLSHDVDCESLADKVAGRSDGFTPAYLKEAFVSAALARAQAGATCLDELFVQAVLAQTEELGRYLKRAKNPDAMGEMRTRDDTIGLRRAN